MYSIRGSTVMYKTCVLYNKVNQAGSVCGVQSLAAVKVLEKCGGTSDILYSCHLIYKPVSVYIYLYIYIHSFSRLPFPSLL